VTCLLQLIYVHFVLLVCWCVVCFNCAIIAHSDVDAALAAEYWGQPALYAHVQHAVMIALGTGVGYSVVVGGKQHLGHFGLLEGGHIIINPSSDLLCGCGQYGNNTQLIELED
jgi:predicted NBD/HSP70 family sugar kinase